VTIAFVDLQTRSLSIKFFGFLKASVALLAGVLAAYLWALAFVFVLGGFQINFSASLHPAFFS
jgi:hypothetical protein